MTEPQRSMHIIKTGRRWLNLQHMVMAEDISAPEDVVRVTMLYGKEFDLTGPDAAKMRSDLDEAAVSEEENPFAGRVAPSVDPATGLPLIAKPVSGAR